MNLTPEILLEKLPLFKNQQVEIIRDQDVNDIIKNLLLYHEKYKSDYEKIAGYFIGVDDDATLRNIFNFQKHFIVYDQETTDNQTLRSPSSILAMQKNDCKNYALFVGGILAALNNAGFYFPFVYRFASYNIFSNIPGHVFVVVYPGTNNEIWVDAVMDEFDDKTKQPYFFTDKKTKSMLRGISGIFDNLVSTGTDLLSQSGAPQTLPITSAPGGDGGQTGQAINVAAQVATGDWYQAAMSAFSLVSAMFGGQPDWQHWQGVLQTKSPNDRAITYLDYIRTLPAYTGGNGDSQEARFNQYRELFATDLTGGQVDKNIADAWNNQWAIMMSSTPNKTDQNLLNSKFTNWSSVNSGYITNGVINQTGVFVAGKTGLIEPTILKQQMNLAPITSATTASTGLTATTLTNSLAGMNIYFVLAMIGAGAYIFLGKKK